MSTIQRVEVIVLALVFSAYVLRRARVARLDMRYAITWLAVVAGVLIVAIFPGAVIWLAATLGFEAGTNMLFIAAIAVLSVIVFRQTMMVSELEKRVVTLTQKIALLQREQKEGEKHD